MSEKTKAVIEAIRGLVAALEEIRDTDEAYKAKIIAKHALDEYAQATRDI